MSAGMKGIAIAAFLCAQVLGGAEHAAAQNFGASNQIEAGAFGGVRLRIPLGGSGREPVRAGLAFAPTMRTRYGYGQERIQISEGIELGVRGARPLSLSIAGQDLPTLRRLGAVPDGARRGGSAVRTVLLVVGGVVVIGGIATFLVFNHIVDNERSGPDGS